MSTRDGAKPRNIQKSATMNVKPSDRPIAGASTMKISVLVQPLAMITPVPALATAAPA